MCEFVSYLEHYIDCRMISAIIRTKLPAHDSPRRSPSWEQWEMKQNM